MSVAADDAAKEKRILPIEALLREQRTNGVRLGNREARDGGSLSRAGSKEGRIGARTQREAKSVEEDRLSRAGFAGKNGEPGTERKIEPVDQDDVAQGKATQHSRGRARSEDGVPNAAEQP